jgi:hypothetical protein
MVIIVSIYKASSKVKKLTENSNNDDIELNQLNENDITQNSLNVSNMYTLRINERTNTLSNGVRSQHIERRASNPYKEKQITIMLLTVSISFVVLTMPYSLFELMRKILDHETFYSIIPKNKVRDFQRATLLLIDLNHSTNFFFYVLTAERFRTQLKSILMFWKKETPKLV